MTQVVRFERLGASGEFDASGDSQVTDLIHDDCQAGELDEFVERLTDDARTRQWSKSLRTAA